MPIDRIRQKLEEGRNVNIRRNPGNAVQRQRVDIQIIVPGVNGTEKLRVDERPHFRFVLGQAPHGETFRGGVQAQRDGAHGPAEAHGFFVAHRDWHIDLGQIRVISKTEQTVLSACAQNFMHKLRVDGAPTAYSKLVPTTMLAGLGRLLLPNFWVLAMALSPKVLRTLLSRPPSLSMELQSSVNHSWNW